MAHQTGIEPSEELKEIIAKALNGSLRFLKINIQDETLVPAESSDPHGTWEEDLDAMLPSVLDENSPCYIFYRLDDRNSHQNFLWVFMSYTPDFANVRDKMLYAATKATVKRAFQSGVVIDDIAATTKEELSLAGYRRHVESQKAAPPLTEAEQHMIQMNESEDHVDVGTTTRQSHLHGVAFPINQDALDALEDFRDGRAGYVQLSVDVKAERILLDRKEEAVDADSLSQFVPEGEGRYHFYQFNHTHEGDYQEAIVFIYSSPGFKSSIKERMLYASCKEPLISIVEEKLGLPIAKKIEIDSSSELNEAYLMDEVHPQKAAYRPQFMRPPPPSNRKRSRSPGRPPVSD